MRFIIFLLLVPLFSLAQGPPGSRLSALGGAAAGLRDLWAIQANPAGISGIPNPTVALTHIRHFLVRELQTTAFGCVLPGPHGVIGVSAHRYGFDSYSRLSAGFAYSKPLGKRVAAGLALFYRQEAIKGFGSNSSVLAAAGIQFSLSPTLTAGAYVQELALRLPVAAARAALGIGWLATDKLLMSSDIYRANDAGIQFAAGIEYSIIEAVSIRAGMQSLPAAQHAGFGWRYQAIDLDFTFSRHSELGFSPQLSFAYAF